MINVEGDAIGAGIVAHLARRQLGEDSEDPAAQEELNDLEKPETVNFNGNVNRAYDPVVEERTAL